MSGSGRHRPQHNSSHTPPSRPPPNINKMQSGQTGGQPYYGAHGMYNMIVMKYQIVVVGVVTRLWTAYPRTPLIPSREEFSLFLNIQAGSCPHPASDSVTWFFTSRSEKVITCLHVVPRLTLSARHPFQNFSTSCILNVNNTGAKQRSIMK
jgi:hypothetical protein